MKRWWFRTAILATVAVAIALTAAMAGGGDQSAVPESSGPTGMLANSGTQASARTASNASPSSRRAVIAGPTTGPVVSPHALNVDLRSLPQVPPSPTTTVEFETLRAIGSPKDSATVPDAPRLTPQAPNMPAPIQNFAGLDFATIGAGYPPDTVGDVGPNHYIQAVNTGFRIFNKTGGVLATSSFAALWAPFTTVGSCDTLHGGDPTVVYDPIGNRWFVADFSWANLDNGPYYQCVAVSKTGDPVAGGWWLYEVRSDDAAHPWFMDYPKMGVWPDGVYWSYNAFNCANSCGIGTTNEGTRAQALSRTGMEAGAGVFTISFDLAFSGCFSVDPCYFGLLPGNLRGDLPPAGRENFYASEDQLQFGWEIWKFHVDFGVPANSTFTGPTNVSQTGYGCCTFPDIDTPGNDLDSLADRLMMQNQYRNIGGTESVWLTHTVPIANGTLPELTQWAQINVTGGTVNTTPVQQQIYGNFGDGLSRWMSSLAVDKVGNMALGYSIAGVATSAGIAYNGRLVTDPLNMLPQGETILVAGTGDQTNNCGGAPCLRWGDYSAMTIDPDGCTFWYTNEYYVVDGGNWNTRIGAFRYPGVCVPTGVSVKRFAATRTKQAVALVWRTSSESEILGFNLWRSSTMKSWRKVNATLIAAKRTGQAAGASYRFVDRAAKRGKAFNYRLQIIDLKGKRSWHSVGAVPAAR